MTTPSWRVVAPSCGLFLTYRESKRLKITITCTYIQSYTHNKLVNDFAAFGALASLLLAMVGVWASILAMYT
jgi:hypothetical protein